MALALTGFLFKSVKLDKVFPSIDSREFRSKNLAARQTTLESRSNLAARGEQRKRRKDVEKEQSAV